MAEKTQNAEELKLEGRETQVVDDVVLDARPVENKLIKARIAKHVNVIDPGLLGYPFKAGCSYWIEEDIYKTLYRDGGISTEVVILVPQKSFVYDPQTKELSPIQTETLKPQDIEAIKAEGKLLLMRGYEHPLSPEPLMSEVERELKALALEGKIRHQIKNN